jgi:hypothetical protein
VIISSNFDLRFWRDLTPDIEESPMTTNQQTAVTIQAFYKALERHDWYFGMSSDPRVYRLGSASYAALEAVACAGGESFQTLLNEYSKHCFTGKSWGTVQHPKPPAPGSTAADVMIDQCASSEEAQAPVAARGVKRNARGRKESLQWFLVPPKRQSRWMRLAALTGITVKAARIIYKRLVVALTTPIH